MQYRVKEFSRAYDEIMGKYKGWICINNPTSRSRCRALIREKKRNGSKLHYKLTSAYFEFERSREYNRVIQPRNKKKLDWFPDATSDYIPPKKEIRISVSKLKDKDLHTQLSLVCFLDPMGLKKAFSSIGLDMFFPADLPRLCGIIEKGEDKSVGIKSKDGTIIKFDGLELISKLAISMNLAGERAQKIDFVP